MKKDLDLFITLLRTNPKIDGLKEISVKMLSFLFLSTAMFVTPAFATQDPLVADYISNPQCRVAPNTEFTPLASGCVVFAEKRAFDVTFPYLKGKAMQNAAGQCASGDASVIKWSTEQYFDDGVHFKVVRGYFRCK